MRSHSFIQMRIFHSNINRFAFRRLSVSELVIRLSLKCFTFGILTALKSRSLKIEKNLTEMIVSVWSELQLNLSDTQG